VLSYERKKCKCHEARYCDACSADGRLNPDDKGLRNRI
jgi:hypothetical protein